MWLARRLWSSDEPTSRAASRPAGLAAYTVQDSPAELVTVRLPDGRLVEGERADARGAANGARQNPTLVLMTPPDGPRPPRRHWYSRFPRWLRWTTAIVVIVEIGR